MTNLVEVDAMTLASGISGGEISCQALMADTLDHIESVNPEINAIVSLRSRDELMEEARLADKCQAIKPLHGIPIAIKDLADTKGLLSTQGSPIFSNCVPECDDLMVSHIRAAGAIIIGKTNTPEFGLGSQSYNPVHGVTRNPFDLNKTSGGSSGGAAAALAARMVSVADGSDMMGSLRNPAAFCNVYGFRPSYGLVPDDPNGETFLHQLSTSGPMARTVSDLAFLLDIICGPEPGNPHSLPAQPSFAESLMPVSAKCRIGWIGNWNGYYPMEPEILSLCEQALTPLRDEGHDVEEIVPDFDPHDLWMSWTRLRSLAMVGSLGKHYDNPKERELLKPEAIFEIENGLSLHSREVIEASAIRSRWFAYMAELFRSFDAVILPSAQVLPFDAEMHWPKSVNGVEMSTYHQWMEIVIPASLIGLPAINVPVGFSTSGLPMGMQIISRHKNDQQLLNLAERYHRSTRWSDVKPRLIAGRSATD